VTVRLHAVLVVVLVLVALLSDFAWDVPFCISGLT
jgi:hypothetical protein